MEPPAQTSAVSAGQLLARLENVPFTRWHMKARVIMGSATFFDAFGALSLAFALPVLNRLWHMSPQQSGLLIGATYVGQLGGAFLFSWMAERHGRVRSASIAVGIIAVMSLACALAQNLGWLIACRMVQGIGIGGEMPVAAAYISELSPAHRRGKFFLLYEMIFPVGVVGSSLGMANHLSHRRHSMPADRHFGGSASRIAPLADLAGPSARGGAHRRAN
jgi:putative MFS transporter